MALRWDVSAVTETDSIPWIEAPEDMPMHGVKAGESVMNPLTNSLIWATMAVDLGEITEANAAEFFARLRFTERLNGPFLIRPVGEDGTRPEGDAAFITEEEVKAHVGLSTNVTNLSRTRWLNRLKHSFDGDLNRLVQRFESKQEVTS